MFLYIIRHAQSSNNALSDQRERVSDPLLTALGLRQAELLAARLAGGTDREATLENPDPESAARGNGSGGIIRLYCSPMRRALQTAEIIGRALGLTPEVWVDVHEEGGIWLDHGEPLGTIGYPGLTRRDVERSFPGFVLPEEITPTGWWRGGREQIAEAAGRARRVAALLRERAGEPGRIAMVTHGAFAVHLTRALLDQPADQPVFYHHDNTGVTLLRFRTDGELSVRYMNRVDHLPAEMLT